MTQTRTIVNGRIEGGLLKMARPDVSFWPDCDVVVTIEPVRPTRSPKQNRKWFRDVVQPLSKHCHVSSKQMHEALKVLFLPVTTTIRSRAGAVLHTVVTGDSTSAQSVKEFTNLIERGLALIEAIPIDIAPPIETTHWAEWDEHRYPRGGQVALCGTVVQWHLVDQHPTCPSCASLKAELDAARL